MTRNELICGWCGAPLDPAEAYWPVGIDGPLYCSPAHTPAYQMLANLDADDIVAEPARSTNAAGRR